MPAAPKRACSLNFLVTISPWDGVKWHHGDRVFTHEQFYLLALKVQHFLLQSRLCHFNRLQPLSRQTGAERQEMLSLLNNTDCSEQSLWLTALVESKEQSHVTSITHSHWPVSCLWMSSCVLLGSGTSVTFSVRVSTVLAWITTTCSSLDRFCRKHKWQHIKKCQS